MRIFVTVGTQLPFDRLIEAVDAWAARHPEAEVFAQIGATALRPRHIAFKDFIENAEAKQQLLTADLVVAHAGMGTILTRLETGLPMLVMPRQAARGEHRNDHQLATAKRLAHLPGLQVVDDEVELEDRLDDFEPRPVTTRVDAVASPALISAIRDFVSA